MTITDVRVRKIAKEGKMKAIVSITVDDEFVVHDIKVIEGDKGLIIAMPSTRSADVAKLFFGGRRSQILPPFRQNGQISDTPLDVLSIVNIGWSQLHQMTHAPADEIAVALKVAVFAAGCAKDFCIGHSNRGFFCYN